MPKADTSVKWFHSDMPGAPILRGEPGALIELLDACLISGFDPRTPDSITVAGEVATVTLGGGNPFEKHAVVAITGASVAALNAEWRIATSAAASFTFACPGVADGPATGATVKRAPAGWAKPFADVNVGVYQSLDPASTQLYLRVADTDARYAIVRGYEQMTDANTGAGLFPTDVQRPNGLSWAKSNEASAAHKRWAVFADGSIVYVYLATYGALVPTLVGFGDLVSFLAEDRYHCVIVGSAAIPNTSYPGLNVGLVTPAVSAGCYVARASSQTGTAAQWARSTAFATVSGYPYGSGKSAPIGGELILSWPVFADDGHANNSLPIRGYVPGVIAPLHPAYTGVLVETFDGSGAFEGRSLVGLMVGEAAQYGSIVIDVTGPWR